MVVPIKKVPSVAVCNVVHDDLCGVKGLLFFAVLCSMAIAVILSVDLCRSCVFICRMRLFRSQNGWRCHQEKT